MLAHIRLHSEAAEAYSIYDPFFSFVFLFSIWLFLIRNPRETHSTALAISFGLTEYALVVHSLLLYVSACLYYLYMNCLLLIAAHLDSLLFLVERPDFKWGPESHKCLLDCYLLMTPSLLPSSTYNYYSTVLYTFQCSTYIVFLLFATYVKCMQEYS